MVLPTAKSIIEAALAGDTNGNDRKRTLLNKHYLTQEVNRLLALYRQITDRPPTAGGAQHLLMKSGQKFDFASTSGIDSTRTASFSDLSVTTKLYIFSMLDADDLCKACSVSKEWNILASDEVLWSRRLQECASRWQQIYYDRNPDSFKRVCPQISSKAVYIHCRPVFRRPIPDGSGIRFANIFHHFIMIPSYRPRIVMFGPGLETKTSKIVRSILTDRCLNESARFKVTGMVRGEFAGVGSGISVQFGCHAFNLVTLYSNVKSVRQRLSAENRVRQNKLFIHEERGGDENVVTEYYELSPAIQELCKHSAAFIFIVDSTQSKREISLAQPELFAMTCELWAPSSAPLLVLNGSRGSIAASQTLSSVDVVRSLRLDRLNRKWMVQSCDVESLNGVRSGIRWVLGEL